MKFLALTSKVKALVLASKPQVLENCPVLDSRTAVFFIWLKFCRSAERIFSRLFFLDRLKKIFEDLFLRTLVFVSLVLTSSIPVLGLESVCPRKGCSWPWSWPQIFFVSLASSLVSSTPPLFISQLTLI